MTGRPHFNQRRIAWWMLAGSAFLLESTAAWFQYGMELDPCVLCVYQRVAVLGILAAGLLGAIWPRLALLRWGGYLLWATSAGWGLRLALEHVGYQVATGPTLSCTFSANFPSWAKLDEWWPAAFQPTGYCEDIQWQWLSLSMAQWMVVVFSVYLVILAVVVIAELRHGRSKRPKSIR